MAANKDKLLANAQKLVEKGKLEKAIEQYTQYLEEEPGDVRILLKVGDLYSKLNQRPEAVETYLKVAQHYGDQGFYLKAVAVYKQVLKLDPSRVDVNIRLAELYKQLGLLSDAMTQYEVAASQLQKAGRTQESLEAIREMVELEPDNVASRIKLAELYSKEGMSQDAISEFGRAADMLREQNRIDDWIKVAERLVWHQQDNYEVQRELAATYIRRGDARRALQKLQVCFKANPQDTDTLALLAQAFEALGQVPKTVSVLRELARILHERGDMNGRNQTYQRILELMPTDEEALEALGRRRRPAPTGGPSTASVQQAEQPSRASAPRTVEPQRVQAPRIVEARGPDLALPTAPPPAAPAARPPARAPTPPPPTPPDDEAYLVAPPADAEVEELDFPADLSEVSELSARAESPEQEISRILTETEVYIKYGLLDRAVEHLSQVFERAPDHLEARLKLKDLYVRAGRTPDAVKELLGLGQKLRRTRPEDAIRFVEEAIELEVDNGRARTLLEELLGAHEAQRRIDEIASRGDGLAHEVIDEVDAEIGVEVEHGSGFYEAADASAFDPMSGGAEVEVSSDPAADEQLPDFLSGEGVTPEPVQMEVTQEVRAEDLLAEADASRVRRAPPADVEEATTFGGPALLGMIAEVDGPTEEVDVDSLPGASAEDQGAFSERDDFAAALEAEVGAEMEEADFFVQQGLYDAAREILEELQKRYPDARTLKVKLEEVRGLEQGLTAPPVPEVTATKAEEPPQEVDRDAVYELSRRAIVDKQVSPEDFETHRDLGIAYKEMGLYDDAIQEFKMVTRAPGQEVFCLTMIGSCYVEKGGISDGIASFKKALYVEGISEREQLQLYYELGRSYERLNDPGEALYYFEKVLKKDPKFRDVEQVVDRLHAQMSKGKGGGQNGGGQPTPPVLDDIDLDSVLGIEDETNSGVEPPPRA